MYITKWARRAVAAQLDAQLSTLTCLNDLFLQSCVIYVEVSRDVELFFSHQSDPSDENRVLSPCFVKDIEITSMDRHWESWLSNNPKISILQWYQCTYICAMFRTVSPFVCLIYHWKGYCMLSLDEFILHAKMQKAPRREHPTAIAVSLDILHYLWRVIKTLRVKPKR